jgi:hypothetical protein
MSPPVSDSLQNQFSCGAHLDILLVCMQDIDRQNFVYFPGPGLIVTEEKKDRLPTGLLDVPLPRQQSTGCRYVYTVQ